MKISNLTSSVYYVTLPKREVSIGFPLAITRIILMNIVLNLKENPSLSQKEREKILALLQNQVAGDINLSISDETQEEEQVCKKLMSQMKKKKRVKRTKVNDFTFNL